MKKKKSQVWIETVIYTLIGFVIIGAVLAIAKPKIEQFQDKLVIESTIELLEKMDNSIIEVGTGVQGNKRIEYISIKKGELIINATGDIIIFSMDSKYTYSQPGIDVNIASIVARTEKKGSMNKIILKKDYSGSYNITFDNQEITKKIGKSPTPYTLSILNSGENPTDKKSIINIEVS